MGRASRRKRERRQTPTSAPPPSRWGTPTLGSALASLPPLPGHRPGWWDAAGEAVAALDPSVTLGGPDDLETLSPLGRVCWLAAVGSWCSAHPDKSPVDPAQLSPVALPCRAEVALSGLPRQRGAMAMLGAMVLLGQRDGALGAAMQVWGMAPDEEFQVGMATAACTVLAGMLAARRDLVESPAVAEAIDAAAAPFGLEATAHAAMVALVDQQAEASAWETLTTHHHSVELIMAVGCAAAVCLVVSGVRVDEALVTAVLAEVS